MIDLTREDSADMVSRERRRQPRMDQPARAYLRESDARDSALAFCDAIEYNGFR